MKIQTQQIEVQRASLKKAKSHLAATQRQIRKTREKLNDLKSEEATAKGVVYQEEKALRFIIRQAIDSQEKRQLPSLSQCGMNKNNFSLAMRSKLYGHAAKINSPDKNE